MYRLYDTDVSDDSLCAFFSIFVTALRASMMLHCFIVTRNSSSISARSCLVRGMSVDDSDESITRFIFANSWSMSDSVRYSYVEMGWEGSS